MRTQNNLRLLNTTEVVQSQLYTPGTLDPSTYADSQKKLMPNRRSLGDLQLTKSTAEELASTHKRNLSYQSLPPLQNLAFNQKTSLSPRAQKHATIEIVKAQTKKFAIQPAPPPIVLSEPQKEPPRPNQCSSVASIKLVQEQKHLKAAIASLDNVEREFADS